MTSKDKSMTSLQDIVLAALNDLKAINIHTMDVRQLTTVTDTMIVATGNSSRHVRALAENVLKKVKEAHFSPMGIEGMDSAEWILVDLNEVVIHVMLAHTREFYGLDKLWTRDQPNLNILAGLK